MFDKVFLDLEETVITNWHDRYYTNVQKVRTWLRENSITEVGIFSFAIYDDKDKEIFATQMKAGLTECFGVQITEWPSVLDMMKVDYKHTRVHMDDVHEYIAFRGKQQGFINYVNELYPDSMNVALLDDVVEDVTLTYRNLSREVHLVNVLHLPGAPAYQTKKLAWGV